MTITIDIDTGGTFADGFVVRDGQPHAVKVLTTPHDLAVCFSDVIHAAAGAVGLSVADLLDETESVRYATTVGTNAVIERRGPRLGLLAGGQLPAGDGRGWGVGLFVDREMVRDVLVSDPAENGAASRASASGSLGELLESGARGLVCSLPQSGRGGDRERQLRDAFLDQYPRHCLDAVPLLLSSEVSEDPDDRRRTATTLFDAYVHPDVADFLYRAEDHLRDHGYRRPLLAVHNDGGCARIAKTIAGKTYSSGPMAGLLGGGAIAELYGIDTLVTLDMGGTSLDVGVVRRSEIPISEHGLIEDVEISFPLPDLVALGAGGGSIAWLDGDRLRVGPRSAGAKPGPACFGFGGDEPTVTDADVVLGILRPQAFMGGRMPIDPDASRRVVGRLAEEIGCSLDEAAERIRATVHSEMGERLAEELRSRGVEPGKATVLAFGGNGATHAAGIAAAAGIGDVLTLAFSPVFSAFGASTVDVIHAYESRAGGASEAELTERALRDMRGEGFGADEVELASSEVERDGERWLKVEARRPMPHLEFSSVSASGHDASTSVIESVSWPGRGRVETPVYRSDELEPGAALRGPALVEASKTTCAVPPEWSLRIDEYGAQRLRREDGGTQ
jgi:N-methylhydantoinase A/oxoprolinase/acetone carboxylase beta subunit